MFFYENKLDSIYIVRSTVDYKYYKFKWTSTVFNFSLEYIGDNVPNAIFRMN